MGAGRTWGLGEHGGWENMGAGRTWGLGEHELVHTKQTSSSSELNFRGSEPGSVCRTRENSLFLRWV